MNDYRIVMITYVTYFNIEISQCKTIWNIYRLKSYSLSPPTVCVRHLCQQSPPLPYFGWRISWLICFIFVPTKLLQQVYRRWYILRQNNAHWHGGGFGGCGLGCGPPPRLGLVPSYFLCQDMQYLDYNIGSGISQMVDALTNYTSSIRFFNDLFEIV